MYRKFLNIIAVLAVGILFVSAGTLLVEKKDSPELTDARINLTIRSIGHQLLLHSGDSSSRVMPVRKINAATFLLEFQSPFAFVPDTLVQVVHRSVAAAHLPLHYMVNVLSCTNNNLVVYGYEFLEQKKEAIPCTGRIQPVGCYVIRILFPDQLATSNASAKTYVWLAALSAMLLVAFVGSGFRKRDKTENKPNKHQSPETGTFIALGKYAFYDMHRRLKSENESIELSDKESRLLKIFASHPNQTIDRERLLKEVWEDDGVFVGRSLDVFVSKLRKKLQNDSSLRLVNVHGKGYKLETEVNYFS